MIDGKEAKKGTDPHETLKGSKKELFFPVTKHLHTCAFSRNQTFEKVVNALRTINFSARDARDAAILSVDLSHALKSSPAINSQLFSTIPAGALKKKFVEVGDGVIFSFIVGRIKRRLSLYDMITSLEKYM